ncbi:hypothetical protein [Mesorhizobium sp. WSM4904]|uniref:hypothetical protein n=1 Tax=Mesorhizobium sp. WSM4904 TaxID=3038545 RepID=UPI0024182E0B|nr:hypothetical protein [Mesorhizobium sp. WSM4904]WFP62148.1 hypothetical protein QAZ47_27400 [Mesorhizobium sp. WSM4904]
MEQKWQLTIRLQLYETFGWLASKAPLISAFASIGMLVIWSIYLHIFWRSHQRRRTPKLLINWGEGRELSARCFVTNMSEGAVFIQSVMVDLGAPLGRHRIFISDAEDLRNSKRPSGWKYTTRQGPLGTGELIDMGSFEGILDYALHEETGDENFGGASLSQKIHQFEITIIGMYGSEDTLIGASRRFEIVHAAEPACDPRPWRRTK